MIVLEDDDMKEIEGEEEDEGNKEKENARTH